MSKNWITGLTQTSEQLASQVDDALTVVEQMAKAGFVGTVVLDPNRSQFFTDEGTLKFYNATTGIIKTVDLT